jgi:hypothetical protein
MAIVIVNTPADFVPVNNNVIWTGTSTNVAQPQFKYLVDIVINAVIVYRYKIKPEPGGLQLLVVDVSKILRNYLSKDLYSPTADQGIRMGTNSYQEYEIQIGEEYELVGVLTQWPNLTNATHYVFNGALSYVDFVDFVPSTYLDSKFLTNAPRTQNTFLEGRGALHLMLDVGTTITNLAIETYLGGVLQNSYAIINLGIPTNYYLVAAGVDTINDIDPVYFTVPPVQPIIHTSVDQYIVQVNLSTGSTEQFIYNIVDTCYEPIRVHWLNRLGGYDWFDFELSARDNYSVERRSMKQVPDVVGQTGTVTYSKQDRVNLDYWVKEKRKTALTSNWITGEQSEWLKDMLSSQDIYLEIGGEYIAVNIDQANYDVKYEDRDELFNLEVAFTYAIDSDRQQF